MQQSTATALADVAQLNLEKLNEQVSALRPWKGRCSCCTRLKGRLPQQFVTCAQEDTSGSVKLLKNTLQCICIITAAEVEWPDGDFLP